MKIDNIAGKKFNKLTAISFDSVSNSGNHKWLFSCECGNKKVILKSHAKSGHTKSCGCYNSDLTIKRNTKHNNCKRIGRSKAYSTWSSIKKRCYNFNQSNYERYGARGIKVCDKWVESFENFLEDMGEPPTAEHSIDRINNNGDYEPSNCKWSSVEEQANNKRNSIIITFNNKKQTLAQWCRELNLNYKSTYKKVRNNKSIESIFNYGS